MNKRSLSGWTDLEALHSEIKEFVQVSIALDDTAAGKRVGHAKIWQEKETEETVAP